MSTSTCDACGCTGIFPTYEVREMMLGLRERFTYGCCPTCGQLALVDPPAEISHYYPADYYSFEPAPPLTGPPPSRATRAATAALLSTPRGALTLLGQRGPLRIFRWLAGLGLELDSPILDVGSGAGENLQRLWRAGFTNLEGVDPYIAAATEVAPATTIHKLAAAEITGTYRLIMLHHSLEHMAEPRAVLQSLATHLEPGGAILVRLPITGTLPWRRYGADWVAIDAPRHRFIPTETSMRLLVNRAGLRVEHVFYDSIALQFWGSEQYRRDIPLHDPRSFATDPAASPFTRAQIARWDAQSVLLNLRHDGDAAGFIVRPA